MRGGDYDFGVALATQLAQARDRLTAHLAEAVKRELDEVQYRLVIDCGCALERALQGQESTELEELRTEIAELRAEIARGTNGRLLQLERGDGDPVLPFGPPEGAKSPRRPDQHEEAEEEIKASLRLAEEEEKLMWKRAVQESDRRKAAQTVLSNLESALADEEPHVAPLESQTEGREPQEAATEPQAATELPEASATQEEEAEPLPMVVPEAQGELPAEQWEAAVQQQELGQGQGDEPGRGEAVQQQEPDRGIEGELRIQADAAREEPGRGQGGEPGPQAAAARQEPGRGQPTDEPGEAPKAAKTLVLGTPAHAAKLLAEAAKPKPDDEPKLLASELKAMCKPYLHDQEWSEGPLWIVVGGEDTGGIVVRKGESLASERFPFRLSRGTTIEELGKVGNRLHYKRIRGDGPDWGWVNVMHKDKALVERDAESM